MGFGSSDEKFNLKKRGRRGCFFYLKRTSDNRYYVNKTQFKSNLHNFH